MAEHFSVKFDGPAVEDHTIEAATFGTSLLSISDLIHEAQAVLNPDGPRYNVIVRTSNDGSFEIALELREWLQAIGAFITSQPMDAAAILKTLFGGPGLFEAIRWLRGRAPTRIEDANGRTVIEVDEKEREFAAGVGTLFVRHRVRRNVQRFASPLGSEGIESVEVKISGEEPLHLDANDRPSFATTIDDELVTDEVTTMLLRVEAIRWRSPNWEFREPLTKRLFWARIEDAVFLQRVEGQRELFARGDVLNCRVRIKQWDRGDADHHTEYTIVEVLSHSRDDVGRQLVLPDPRSVEQSGDLDQ